MDNKVLLYSYCIVFPIVNLSLTSRGLCGKACPNDANHTEWSATTCESAHGTVIVSLVRGLGQLSTPIFNIPSNYRPSIRDPPSLSVSLPCLTPSLPRPVKFPGWKTHWRACKQYIFRSCSTSISTQCVSMKILSLSHASAKQRTKRLQGLKFLSY